MNPAAPDQPIGSVVAIHGRHIAVVDANTDKILLFELRDGSWTAIDELIGTDPNECSQTLGGDFANNPVISLAVSDSEVFVGCPMAVNPGLPFEGKVNVYQLPQ